MCTYVARFKKTKILRVYCVVYLCAHVMDLRVCVCPCYWSDKHTSILQKLNKEKTTLKKSEAGNVLVVVFVVYIQRRSWPLTTVAYVSSERGSKSFLYCSWSNIKHTVTVQPLCPTSRHLPAQTCQQGECKDAPYRQFMTCSRRPLSPYFEHIAIINNTVW